MPTFTTEITHTIAADVAVVGGGVAGASAAIASARGGARTVLVEQSGTLGGQAGFGLVTPLSSITSKSGEPFGGLLDELVSKLRALTRAYCIPAGETPGSTIAAPHILSALLLRLCLEAGVEVRFHSTLVGVNCGDDRIKSVVLAEKGRFTELSASEFIDASGDGDLIALAGDDFSLGSEPGVLDSLTRGGLDEVHFSKNGDRKHKYSGYGEKRELQPVSIFFTMGGVDYPRAAELNNKYLTYDSLGLSYDEYAKLPYAGECGFEQVEGDEKLPLPQGRVLVSRGARRDVAVVNMSRVIGIDGSDADSLNRGEALAQLQVLNLVDFLIKYVPRLREGLLPRVCDLARSP